MYSTMARAYLGLDSCTSSTLSPRWPSLTACLSFTHIKTKNRKSATQFRETGQEGWKCWLVFRCVTRCSKKESYSYPPSSDHKSMKVWTQNSHCGSAYYTTCPHGYTQSSPKLHAKRLLQSWLTKKINPRARQTALRSQGPKTQNEKCVRNREW